MTTPSDPTQVSNEYILTEVVYQFAIQFSGVLAKSTVLDSINSSIQTYLEKILITPKDKFYWKKWTKGIQNINISSVNSIFLNGADKGTACQDYYPTTAPSSMSCSKIDTLVVFSHLQAVPSSAIRHVFFHYSPLLTDTLDVTDKRYIGQRVVETEVLLQFLNVEGAADRADQSFLQHALADVLNDYLSGNASANPLKITLVRMLSQEVLPVNENDMAPYTRMRRLARDTRQLPPKMLQSSMYVKFAAEYQSFLTYSSLKEVFVSSQDLAEVIQVSFDLSVQLIISRLQEAPNHSFDQCIKAIVTLADDPTKALSDPNSNQEGDISNAIFPFLKGDYLSAFAFVFYAVLVLALLMVLAVLHRAFRKTRTFLNSTKNKTKKKLERTQSSSESPTQYRQVSEKFIDVDGCDAGSGTKPQPRKNFECSKSGFSGKLHHAEERDPEYHKMPHPRTEDVEKPISSFSLQSIENDCLRRLPHNMNAVDAVPTHSKGQDHMVENHQRSLETRSLSKPRIHEQHKMADQHQSRWKMTDADIDEDNSLSKIRLNHSSDTIDHHSHHDKGQPLVDFEGDRGHSFSKRRSNQSPDTIDDHTHHDKGQSLVDFEGNRGNSFSKRRSNQLPDTIDDHNHYGKGQPLVDFEDDRGHSFSRRRPNQLPDTIDHHSHHGKGQPLVDFEENRGRSFSKRRSNQPPDTIDHHSHHGKGQPLVDFEGDRGRSFSNRRSNQLPDTIDHHSHHGKGQSPIDFEENRGRSFSKRRSNHSPDTIDDHSHHGKGQPLVDFEENRGRSFSKRRSNQLPDTIDHHSHHGKGQSLVDFEGDRGHSFSKRRSNQSPDTIDHHSHHGKGQPLVDFEDDRGHSFSNRRLNHSPDTIDDHTHHGKGQPLVDFEGDRGRSFSKRRSNHSPDTIDVHNHHGKGQPLVDFEENRGHSFSKRRSNQPPDSIDHHNHRGKGQPLVDFERDRGHSFGNRRSNQLPDTIDDHRYPEDGRS